MVEGSSAAARREKASPLVPKGMARTPTRAGTMRLALWASVGWLVVIGAYAVGFFAGGLAEPAPQPQALTALLFLLGAAGPVLMMAFAAMLLDRAEALRAELAALRSGLPSGDGSEPNRFARQAAEQSRLAASRLEAVEKALGEVAAVLATQGDGGSPRPERRTAPPQPQAVAGQPALPFDEASNPTAAPRIPWGDIARALEFPRNADDTAGFDAVRSAIRDPEVARLLQAAEDVLTMLAADGLHMEDLVPDHASLAAWRAYGEGARGQKATAIGGIRDEAVLAPVRARVRGDAIFRDACLVFIRRWNSLVGRVLGEMGEDPLLRDMADTRSGRAFMLVARAMGAFD